MFDSLQEGIITIQDDRIMQINELANSVLGYVAGLKDFQFNTALDGHEQNNIRPLDRKIFYLFQQDNKSMQFGGKKKKKKDMGYKSTSSASIKIEFSLTDFFSMTEQELSGKVFVFDMAMATNDMTQMMAAAGKQGLGIE